MNEISLEIIDKLTKINKIFIIRIGLIHTLTLSINLNSNLRKTFV